MLGSSRRHRRVHGTGARLAAGYVGIVALLEILRRVASWPQPGDLASSPAGVAAGRVWELVTSGLVVAGDPVVQLAGVALTTLVAIQMLGASVFWVAVFAAHVGSALIAYAGVGLLWLVARPDVDAVIDAPDYGISCVWAGVAGALAAAALGRRRKRDRVVALVAVGTFLVVVPPSGGLTGTEHGLAFLLGALARALIRRSAVRPSLASPSSGTMRP